MKSSNNVIKLIKKSEGLSLEPYLCPAGVPTIGFGSTLYENNVPVTLDDASITEERATNIMLHQLVGYENAVNRYVKVNINQNQFDALVDFAYNTGVGNFRTSTLLKKINQKDFEGASKEFRRWIYSNGVVLNGLIVRRRREKDLFIS